MPIHNADTCFNRTTEEYIGTWNGHDVYRYKDSCQKIALLATEGNEPGEYRCFIGDERWFANDATMGGFHNGSIPMVEHFQRSSTGMAFLMAFAVIAYRSASR